MILGGACQRLVAAVGIRGRPMVFRRMDAAAAGAAAAAGRRSVTAASQPPVPAAAPTAVDSGKDDSSDMYRRPQLYDEVFSYRDFPAEAAFLRAAYTRHCPGRPLETALELGCGPARHSTLLAKGGAKVTALDASAAMLEYARSLAVAEGVGDRVTFVEGDMSEFTIKDLEGSLDMAVCLLGTFAHMTSNEAAASCFRSVARHLKPGGLLLLELAHPGDLFDGSLLIGDEGGEMWEVESSSLGGKLLVEWGAEGDDFDPATQVLARSVAVSRLSDKEEVGEAVHASTVLQRAFTLQEVDLLGRLVGLQVVGSYGDLNLEVGLRHEDAYRLVVCLVKQG